ncbi:hypothetical protein K438DRAFT_1864112 [Mycena galopus ATCC 62051]|nr:hypothetical protein K438DRAFT_1864112 [Mycena galopus ATCC 62051]
MGTGALVREDVVTGQCCGMKKKRWVTCEWQMDGMCMHSSKRRMDGMCLHSSKRQVDGMCLPSSKRQVDGMCLHSSKCKHLPGMPSHAVQREIFYCVWERDGDPPRGGHSRAVTQREDQSA